MVILCHRFFFDMTSYVQDGGHDVISHRKVLPSGTAHEASAWRMRSSVRQFLITFVLVYKFTAERASEKFLKLISNG